MEKRRSGKDSFRTRHSRGLRALGFGLMFAFAASGQAFGQQVAVSGTVTNTSGAPLRGVAVQVQGTDTRVFTNGAGRYAVTATTNGILDFTLLGQRSVQEPIRGRTTIDVQMTPIAFLQEM